MRTSRNTVWAASICFLVAIVAAGCQRATGESTTPPPIEPTAEAAPAYAKTVVVDSGLPGRDIVGDRVGVTLDVLPGPDGRTTLVEALFAAGNAAPTPVRVVLDPAGGEPIVVGDASPWDFPKVPANVVLIEPASGKNVIVQAAPGDRREGFWIDAPRPGGEPLVVRGIEFRGFRASAITLAAGADGVDVEVRDCRFAGVERGIFQEAGRLVVQECEFVDSDLIGIKSVGSDIEVLRSRFVKTGLSKRTDHGSYAILLDRSRSALIAGNTFAENTGGDGIAWTIFADGATSCRITENTFRDNDVVNDIAVHPDGACAVEHNEIHPLSRETAGRPDAS